MTDATITTITRRLRAVPTLAPATVPPAPAADIGAVVDAPRAAQRHLDQIDVNVRRLQLSIGGAYTMGPKIAEARVLFEQIAEQAKLAAKALG